MITQEYIENKLRSFDVNPKILDSYHEENRYYHNIDHILYMLNKANDLGVLTDNLFLAIVYHDLVYSFNPIIQNFNEYRSARIFKKHFKGKISKENLKKVYYAIISTKDHKWTSILSYRLIKLDLSILYDSTLSEFQEYEEKIRKEYSNFSNSVYSKHRISILKNLNVSQDKIKLVENIYKI